MKCKFCNSLLLTNEHGRHSDIHIYICVKCPNPVYFTPPNLEEDYSIFCLKNDSWYEIIYLKYSKKYLIYQYIYSLEIDTDYGAENNIVERKLITQLLSDQTITPSNAHEKLLTILTFG